MEIKEYLFILGYFDAIKKGFLYTIRNTLIKIGFKIFRKIFFILRIVK